MAAVKSLAPSIIDTSKLLTTKDHLCVSNIDAPSHRNVNKITNVIDALRFAATHTNEGIVAYTAESIDEPQRARRLHYKDLLAQATANADLLQRFAPVKVQHGSVVIVHFPETLDSIIWYWSVLLAGAIPCIAGPGMFSQDTAAQQKHLHHLCKTLNTPMCITRRSMLGPFQDQNGTGDERIQTLTLEDLDAVQAILSTLNNGARTASTIRPHATELAALMLTSGSSGNAKAVQLSHHQILVACQGKTAAANLQFPYSTRPLLSWVHIDHVANLVQCHIMAIVNCVSQVQVPASEVAVDPCRLLNLVSRHRVARTFAPNFLLAKLRRQLESAENIPNSRLDSDLNLEGLYLDTGGEANVTETCVSLQPLLSKYGAPKDVFKPGFGMTETCAGCIFNNHCPSYDITTHLEFTSLGECMPGVQMRISLSEGVTSETPVLLAKPGQRGALEIQGEAVFKSYFNNPVATAEAFTSDGWFRTGDLAFIDTNGYLHLDGRTKEVININGVKYLPHEIDSGLEQTEIPGATPSYFCCFGIRDASITTDTEVVAVLYLPSYTETDDQARFETEESIIRTVSMYTQSRPKVIPLRTQDMPKSTLGKLSRGKLQAALARGDLAIHDELNKAAIRRYREKIRGQVESPEEQVILDVIRTQLEIAADDDFAPNDSLLSTGATSMDLVAIMQTINKHEALKLEKKLRLIDLLAHPTAKAITKLCVKAVGQHEYDPVVTLQPHGTKAPLWLVHPGVGEILVFVNLAHRITDRPIHALRAKGFNVESGETPFADLEEAFTIYHAAIKKRQPRGPYAIAGYSFGGMIAFEVSKRLEAAGDEVRYCGSWNLPPHIKTRMQELVWHECVHHLFYFIGLMDEETANSHKTALCDFEREGRRIEGIRYLREKCDQARWDELGLSEEYYLNWVNLASRMQGMASDYEPTGSVKCMDVFVAEPLSHVARNRQDWVENKLSAWRDFSREEVRFHDVQGAHYTMLDPEFVTGFGETLRRVLRERRL